MAREHQVEVHDRITFECDVGNLGTLLERESNILIVYYMVSHLVIDLVWLTWNSSVPHFHCLLNSASAAGNLAEVWAKRWNTKIKVN